MTPRHRGHVRLDLSHYRRVLLVSDVHGEYAKLERSLAATSWKPGEDVLIVIGDLTDRGPDSEAALDWIRRDHVHRVIGNHEVMPRMYLNREITRETAIKWGGAWFVDLPKPRIHEIADSLEDAPVAMTVLTPAGHAVGVIHADCMSDWGRHVSLLRAPRDRGHQLCMKISLWSSDTILDVISSHERKGCRPQDVRCQVSGIDHVFHGHTPVHEPFCHDNRTWIDTKAYDPQGRISVVDADFWLSQIEAHRPF